MLVATAALILLQKASLSPAQTADADPLLDVNKVFRAAYAAARKDVLARTGPVIIVSGDELVLLRDGRRAEAKVVPAIYHTLKTVSHIPLAIYAMTALPTVYERFVLPPIQREEAIEGSCSPELCKGECGIGFVQLARRGA